MNGDRNGQERVGWESTVYGRVQGRGGTVGRIAGSHDGREATGHSRFKPLELDSTEARGGFQGDGGRHGGNSNSPSYRSGPLCHVRRHRDRTSGRKLPTV